MASSKGRKGGRVTPRAGGEPASTGRPAPSTVADDDARDDGGDGAPARLTLGGLFRPSAVARGDVGEPERPWWGMGDMVVWFLVAQIAAAMAFVLVVPAAGYSLQYPAGSGAVVGELTGRQAVGLPLALTPTYADIPLALQAVLQVPLWLGFLGGPLYVVWKKGTSLKEDFGLAMRAVDVPVGLAIGVAVQLLLVPGLYWLLFRILGEEYDVSAEARELTSKATSPAGIVLLLVVVGLGAPIFEELFFRGLAQRAIARRLGATGGMVLGGLFFAVAHAQTLQFPALFGFGVLLGYLARRTGRLGTAVFAHMGFNLTAAVTLVWNLQVP